MKRYIVTLFLFWIALTLVQAKGWDAAYISQLIAQGEVDKVIEYYKTNYASSNRDPKDAFRIADLYAQKKEYAAAVEWYEKEKSYLKESKTDLLNLATAYRMTGNYQKALDGFLMYAAETGDVAKVMDEANLCERLVRASSYTDNYFFEPYAFNSENQESQVSVLRDNLIYTVIKSDGTSRVWEANRRYNTWLEPNPVLTKPGEGISYHHMSFTADGNRVVYTVKEMGSGNNSTNPIYKIFLATYLGGQLLNITPFPYNADTYSCKDAAYAADGNEIYFSSDRPGGSGGFDLWKCSRTNGKWDQPQNLGKLINSAADETSPYITLEKERLTLFFASNRDGGFGGLDIYKAYYNNTWQGLDMQPAPINSVSNENSYVYDPETQAGYVSSDRSGGKGGTDIYRVRPLDLKLILIASDSGSREALDYCYLQLYDNNIKIQETVTGTDGRGVIQLGLNRQYTINISKDNYRPRTISFSTKGKYNGDSIHLAVSLLKDPQFSIKNSATGISMQNYIVFMGSFTDGATHKAIRPDMRMVNLNTNKLRILDVDETGSFLIRLMTNNNYKIFIQNKEYKLSDEITTYGLDHGSVKLKNYILNGPSFQPGENRVLAPYLVPDSLKYLWKEEPVPATTNGLVLSTSLPMESKSTAAPAASSTPAPSQPEKKETDMALKPADATEPAILSSDEMYYKIQIGSYAAPATFPGLEGLGQLEESIAYGNHIYRIGNFSDLAAVKEKLEIIHQKGYNLAFILQYRNDKVINIIK